MACQKCESKRILTLSAKCSDACFVEYDELEKDGYVPWDIGIGGGDYVEIEVCMECGQLQGHFPVDDEDIENSMKGE